MGKLRNHFVVCLDRSGSMSSIQEEAVKAFNSNVVAIRDGSKKEKQDSRVSLYTFGGNIRQEFFDRDVTRLLPWPKSKYSPEGGTPMFDCIGGAVEDCLALQDAEAEDLSFVVLIITDGYENTSQKFSTAEKLNKLMRKVIKTDRWSFAFLMPKDCIREFTQHFPDLPQGNIRAWEQTTGGAQEAAVATGASIARFFTARSAGKRSVTDFFTTDMSKVKVKDVKNLGNVTSEVQVWEVSKEIDIKSFCEAKSKQPYKKGAAFYQLSKPETIQDYKLLLVMIKGKPQVYGGEEARQLLGLPDSGTVRVTPGNHANFDLFGQSTSMNRKLVRGTKLVYWPVQGR